MVYDFERNKIRQQEVEVKALIALLEHGSPEFKMAIETRLMDYAIPERLVKRINDAEKQTLHAKMNSKLDKLEYQ